MIKYNEKMHNTIWGWIKGWCEKFTTTVMSLEPKTPEDVLLHIIEKMNGVQDGHIHYVCEESININYNQEILGDFSNVICEEAQKLFDIGKQDKLSWDDLKDILQYYHYDMNKYFADINRLGMTGNQLNEWLELGIDFSESVPFHEGLFRIIWSRYLNGTCVHDWNEELQRIDTYLLARGEEYWGDRVFENVFGTSDETVLEDLNDYEDKNQEKKKIALKEILNTIDEQQENISEGLYLKLMDLMKEEWPS